MNKEDSVARLLIQLSLFLKYYVLNMGLLNVK
jgi:hypothetical protein